jgi:hypothetical protein
MSSAFRSVPWHEFTVDPRRPDAAGLRASDRDRELVSQVLVEAYADGRLTREEYDERGERTAAARTLGDLPPLVADLAPMSPVPSARDAAALADRDALHRQAVAQFTAQRAHALVGFLVPTLICWSIWFFASFQHNAHPGFPWPLFVMLGTGGNALRVLLNKQGLIAEEERRLERRLEKRLERQERRRLEGPGAG